MENSLRKLQLTQLEILKVVDKFCRENDIKYSLYAGTLIGAIRHKGFIPWDDDLDICMTRENYNKFIKMWTEKGVDGYLLQNKENTPSFTQSFTKIRKEHTTFLQEADLIDKYHTGISIDVFPGDRIPNNKYKKILYRYRCVLYQIYTKGYIPKNTNLLERIVVNFLLKITPENNRQKAREQLLRKITKYNNDVSNPVCFIEDMQSLHIEQPSNLMDDYIELKFEDAMFLSIKKWDIFLKLAYGDYMTLPPKAERIGIHNARIINFEYDYSELIRSGNIK